MNPWFARFITWFLDRVGRGTLLILLLALALAGSLAAGLAEAVRGPSSGLLVSAGFAALLLGWVLARSRMPGLPAWALQVAGGLLFLLARVGRLGGELLRLTVELNDWVSGLLRWAPGLPPPGVEALRLTWTDAWLQVTDLGVRLLSWSIDLANRRAAFDPVSASLVWGLVAWIAAAWLAWGLRRWERPLLAACIPAGTLVSVLSLTGETSYLLLVALAATFSLAAAHRYRSREAGWERQGVDYSEDLRLDVALVTIGLVFSLTMVAAAAPAVSVRGMVDFFEEVFQPPAPTADTGGAGSGSGGGVQPPATAPYSNPGGSLGLETAPRPTQASALTGLDTGGLPRDHLIGAGPELSEELVMWVSLPEDSEVAPALPPGEEPTRYYWRALAYNVYTGRGWSSTRISRTEYDKNEWTIRREELIPPDAPDGDLLLPGQDLVEQVIRLFSEEPANLVFAAGDILTVDHEFEIAWRRLGEQPNGPEASWAGRDFFGASVSTNRYRVRSLRPEPGVEGLRSAGSQYPEWILERYLQLPEEVPGRVRRLAQELTATAPTPYDRAAAIERYLRRFPYSLDVPAPPEDRDVADFFLFDLQQGYCDYYATSMVVLSRAAGLPARLAVGYAGGVYDPEQGRYVVSQAEAHSWPEIFFPGYGWVPFEPTAGLAALDRPDAGIAESLPVEPPSEPAGDWRFFANLLLVAVSILLLASAVVWASRVAADFLVLLPMTPEKALPAVYGRLHRQSALLQVPHERGDTPYEFAAAFETQVHSLSGRQPRWLRFLEPAAEEANQIVSMYVRSRYGQERPAIEEKQLALRLWSRLQRRIWLARLRMLMGRRAA